AEGGGESIFAEINITPLTDVFLVMVIIFMVSALAAQVEKEQEKKKVDTVTKKQDAEQRSGIKVNLPQGQAQEIDPSKVSLILVVPLEGEVSVLGKAIADQDLDNLFRASFARDKQTQVILKIDKGVNHGRVVGIMERAKAAGLTRLAFGTSGGG
ncbi:MAG: biopolymer transporter ExbD, partial [Proteobacteria bacterium]|nr:biopolymer transporter ExbD [Pseudomonadota bacterium]